MQEIKNDFETNFQQFITKDYGDVLAYYTGGSRFEYHGGEKHKVYPIPVKYSTSAAHSRLAAQRQMIVSICLLKYLVSRSDASSGILKKDYKKAGEKILEDDKLFRVFAYMAAGRVLGRCVPTLPNAEQLLERSAPNDSNKQDTRKYKKYQQQHRGYRFCWQAHFITGKIINAKHPKMGKYTIAMGENTGKVNIFEKALKQDKTKFNDHEKHQVELMSAVLESTSLLEGQRLMSKPEINTDYLAIGKVINEDDGTLAQIKYFVKKHRELIESDQGIVMSKLGGKFRFESKKQPFLKRHIIGEMTRKAHIKKHKRYENPFDADTIYTKMEHFNGELSRLQTATTVEPSHTSNHVLPRTHKCDEEKNMSARIIGSVLIALTVVGLIGGVIQLVVTAIRAYALNNKQTSSEESRSPEVAKFLLCKLKAFKGSKPSPCQQSQE